MADHLVGGLHCAEAEDLSASFVLGALEPAEAETVRAHLAGCPEAHPEFAELGAATVALLETVELVEPPSSLKGRILAAAAAEAPGVADTQRTVDPQRAVADTQRVVDPGRPIDTPRAIDTQRATDTQRGGWASVFRRPVWAGVAMAAVVAVVALGAWNVALRSDVDGLTAYRNGVAAVLQAAARPDAQLAVLAAPDDPAGPSGLAAVGGDGSIALVMRDLAPTAGTEVYEAWLIVGTNAPIPIGSFTVGTTRTATFATNHVPFPGVTLALTREPGPNATTPTMPIIAAGAARIAS